MPFQRFRPVKRRAKEYERLGYASYAAGQLDESVAQYERAVLLTPKDPELLSALGQVYFEQGTLDKAETYFRRALEFDIRNPWALKGLGLTLQLKGDQTQAVYLYYLYLEINSRDVDVLINLGALLDNLGRHDEAIGYYETAGELDPNNAVVQENLGRAYYDLGELDLAAERFGRALELAPDSAEVHRLMGLLQLSMGDTKQAIEMLEIAVANDSGNAGAHWDLARTLAEGGRPAEAVGEAELAVQLFDREGDRIGEAQALWELGWIQYKLKNWKQSIEASSRALELDPKLAPIRFNLGLALLHEGNATESREQYKVGLDMAEAADLKWHGISDLEEALSINPDLQGGDEILQMLEEKYLSVTSSRRSRRPEPS